MRKIFGAGCLGIFLVIFAVLLMIMIVRVNTVVAVGQATIGQDHYPEGPHQAGERVVVHYYDRQLGKEWTKTVIVIKPYSSRERGYYVLDREKWDWCVSEFGSSDISQWPETFRISKTYDCENVRQIYTISSNTAGVAVTE